MPQKTNQGFDSLLQKITYLTPLILEFHRPAFACYLEVPSWPRRSLFPQVPATSVLEFAPFYLLILRLPSPLAKVAHAALETTTCRICHDARRVGHVISLWVWRDVVLTRRRIRLAVQRFCAVCCCRLPSELHIAVVIPHLSDLSMRQCPLSHR
ncbi:hypothetical protein CORC01_09113 [Colletotrichum orchidophilum]|uniref:Uncharacterized protein n=1 Tax=Colletotrichum orchidophilum TaxID=1209926 RepID=A0A1G4B2F0_9PEZI|nr:uncharacterized protein CORC01_09113 [Colletotrichum orchidophilum]OHE95523.1 hypothetical protein CORC01_09113 [Colletotrichum orchidophilum]